MIVFLPETYRNAPAYHLVTAGRNDTEDHSKNHTMPDVREHKSGASPFHLPSPPSRGDQRNFVALPCHGILTAPLDGMLSADNVNIEA